MDVHQFPWLTRVRQIDAGNPRKARRLLFANTESMLAAGELDGLRQLMREVDGTAFSDEVAVGFLRTTCRIREMSPEWGTLQRRVRTHLLSHHSADEVSDMLAGL